jgi:hypothetical protein
MSGREVDLDSLFDRNADTQLLDRRRREELGLVAQRAPASSTPVRFGPESMLGEELPPRPRAAVLRVALDARPQRELIPGAVVTIVASVHDDGDAPASDVLLRITVPSDCEAVPDSFARGDAALDGDALLGEGLRLGTVAASEAVRVRFTMRVLSGTGPLDVLAHASAPGVPTIAAPTLRLTRRAGHAAFDAPRPFFELEADETDASLTPDTEIAAIAAPETPRTVDTIVDEPAAPKVIAPEVVAPEAVAPEAVAAEAVAPPVIVPDYVIVKPAPRAPVVPDVVVATETPLRAPDVIAPAVVVVKRVSKPGVNKPAASKPAKAVTPEPKPAPPEPKPTPKPKPAPKPRARKRAAKPAPEAPRPHVLARALDEADVYMLERIFAGAIPHGLAAVALLSSVAAVDAPLGNALGVRDFARTISAAVPRALVAARTNRPAPPIVTRESLETVRAFAPAPAEPFVQEGPLLVTRLDERELDGLRSVLARDLDDVFLRGAQVLLAVAPRALDGVAPDAGARAAEALAAFRVAAGAWLMRVTVRRAVDRRYDPLVANDASLHEAGRVLVAALRAALP